MKALLAILALMVANHASVALAQQEQEDVAVQTVAEELAAASKDDVVTPKATPSQPIYILNNQRVQQGTNVESQQGAVQAPVQIQEQPVSVVQDSPLTESPADLMRKRRQQSESATEDGIVQALERARLDDEVRRRDKFNNAIAPVVSQESTPAPYVQPQPVVVQQVVPAPVAEPAYVPASKRYKVATEDYGDDDDLKESSRKEKVDIRSEIRAALEESKPAAEATSSYYVSGFASFGNYDQVVNINSSMGYGFSVGAVTPERIVAEGSFIYGNYQIENLYWNSFYPMRVDMRQYNVSGAVKYVLLPGRFRPNAGAVLSYTRRQYSQERFDFRTSDAIDVGATAGADLQVSDNFAIGVDVRYMTNLGYKQNLKRHESFVFSQSKNDVERMNYYTLNLIGKFTF